jgi:hypothetical protein
VITIVADVSSSAHLRKTVERLVDFDLVNLSETRLPIFVIDLKTARSHCPRAALHH